MTRIYCWLIAGVLLVAPSFTAYGQAIPITTAQGEWALATFFQNGSWRTNSCEMPTQINGYPAWGAGNWIRVGDFNGNGLLDVASLRANTVMIKTADPDPIYPHHVCLRSLPPFFVTEEWGTSEYTWVGDFNGDGKDDLASAEGPNVYMKLSNPGLYDFNGFTSDTWLAWAIPEIGPFWGSSSYTWIGDFNGDHRDDIASAEGGVVHMKLSTGSSFSIQHWSVTNQWGIAAFTRIGDFNGDGMDDIASAQGSYVFMKLSTGSGFNSVTWIVANAWGGGDYTWVADFNRDGRDDIASAQGGFIHMKLSQGSSFSSQSWPVSPSWGSSSYTWIIDFNNDGYKDIVSAQGLELFVKRNNYGTGFVSESGEHCCWWSTPQFTWALDRTP